MTTTPSDAIDASSELLDAVKAVSGAELARLLSRVGANPENLVELTRRVSQVANGVLEYLGEDPETFFEVAALHDLVDKVIPQWYCPEHEDLCVGEDCCCADLHSAFHDEVYAPVVTAEPNGIEHPGDAYLDVDMDRFRDAQLFTAPREPVKLFHLPSLDDLIKSEGEHASSTTVTPEKDETVVRYYCGAHRGGPNLLALHEALCLGTWTTTITFEVSEEGIEYAEKLIEKAYEFAIERGDACLECEGCRGFRDYMSEVIDDAKRMLAERDAVEGESLPRYFDRPTEFDDEDTGCCCPECSEIDDDNPGVPMGSVYKMVDGKWVPAPESEYDPTCDLCNGTMRVETLFTDGTGDAPCPRCYAEWDVDERP